MRITRLNKVGTLYVVATPIGNLGDMSLRAIEVLKRVKLIAAEDSRHASKLLNHYSIEKPIISLHDFNEKERAQKLIHSLKEGDDIALISDAGTPLISDPGYRLVTSSKEEGIVVVPIPGACAAIVALSASGLPTDRFVFEGFLPAVKSGMNQRLEELLSETRTIIFYVAPHRLMMTLEAMMQNFGGERLAVVARELTKLYESIKLTSLKMHYDYYAAHEDEQRGEIVLLVKGVEKEAIKPQGFAADKVLEILLKELSVKQASHLASEITGERKNFLYEKALGMKNK